MNTYLIKRCSQPINWDQIPALSISNYLWMEPLSISANAQLCYDDEALYVHMWATEKNILAEQDGPTGLPNLDSCLEFFFSPDPEDSRYFNFEFNPLVCVNVGFGYDRYKHVRLLRDGEFFQAKVNCTENGWEIFYQIPYDFIRWFFPGFSPASGDQMRANFYKCGDHTAEPHYIAWNPVTQENPDFHVPTFFGTLYFE